MCTFIVLESMPIWMSAWRRRKEIYSFEYHVTFLESRMYKENKLTVNLTPATYYVHNMKCYIIPVSSSKLLRFIHFLQQKVSAAVQFLIKYWIVLIKERTGNVTTLFCFKNSLKLNWLNTTSLIGKLLMYFWLLIFWFLYRL